MKYVIVGLGDPTDAEKCRQTITRHSIKVFDKYAPRA